MTNNYLTFQLPRGYTDEAGTLHREVEMNPLTGKEEELVAQNHGQAVALLVTMVMGRCMRRLGSIAPVPGDVINRLPGEDRQFLLFKLREITFGDRVQATVECPWSGCGNKVDINFSTKDITEGEHVEKEPQIELELETNCPGCGREFTIPFDITGFFTRELRTTIDLLYREVHFLAYHYHWSEREILEMSREKRHKYIEILLEEIEKMMDERIEPPGGFKYGNVNYPFMLDSQAHESFSPGLHPKKEHNTTGINGEQDPGDDAHEMNHHRMKTRQNHPMKNETLPGSDVRDTDIEENTAEEIRERENIEIPGCTEKGIAFPSLHRGNPQSIDLELNSMPRPGPFNPPTEKSGDEPGEPGNCSRTKFQGEASPSSVGVNLVSTRKKDKIKFSAKHPDENKVTEIETQLPGKVEEIGTHTPMTVTGSDNLQKPEHRAPCDNTVEMVNRSKTLDRENPQFIDMELNGMPRPGPFNSTLQRSGNEPREPGEVLKTSQKSEPGGCARKKDKIEFSANHPGEDKVTESKAQLPGKMKKTGTHTPMTVTGSDNLPKPKDPAPCDNTVEMVNRSKTLDRENPQSIDMELNSMPRPGPFNWPTEKSGDEPGESVNRARNEFQGEASPSSVGVNLVFIQKKDKLVSTRKKDKKESSDSLPIDDKVTESKAQLPAKMEKADKYYKPKLAKDKPVKVQSQLQSPAKIGKAVSGTEKAGVAEKIEKSPRNEKRTDENKVKVISTDEIVNLSHPEAVLRIEQLREQVRRLNAKNSSAAFHSSHLSPSSALSPSDLSLSSSGMEDKVAREIEDEEPVQIPNPPDQPVTIVKSLPSRTNTGQTASAFWERSYLARFHLKTLR